MSSRWRTACLVAALCTMLAAPARADDVLTFGEAARRALASHPVLRGFAAEADAAAARVEGAGLRPGLEVSSELENFAGSGAARGADGAELTVAIGSLLERGGKREARLAAAGGAQELLAVEQRSARLDVLADTARRFVEVGLAQERVALARRALEQADTTLALIEPRVRAARSPRTELLAAELARSQAGVSAEAARRDLAVAQAALAAQWGAADERPSVRFDAGILRDVQLDLPPDAALERTPDLQRYEAEARLLEARARLARAEAVPDWRWQAGVRRLQETRDQALVAGLTIPLGQAARARPRVREAEAERARAAASLEARRIALRRELGAALERLAESRGRFAAISGEQLPRAREARELTERGYRIGRFPYRELAIAGEQVLALEAARLAAARDFHLARIDVERLAGAQFESLED